MRSRLHALAVAAALLLPAAATAQLPPVFIGAFETAAAPGFDPAGPVAVTLRLHPSGPARVQGLRRWFPEARIDGEVAALRLRGYPVPSDPVGKVHRAASFYVDFDEPDVRDLRPAVVERYGAAPGLADLSRFVDAHVEKKNLRRLLDPASVVARRREGDCTEHAVLLTALARLFGHPARMVHGLAVVEVEGRWVTMGHAWSEVHDGRAWTLQDATHPPTGRVLYVPLSSTEDEGPGFTAASIRSLSPLDVASVALAPAKD